MAILILYYLYSLFRRGMPRLYKIHIQFRRGVPRLYIKTQCVLFRRGMPRLYIIHKYTMPRYINEITPISYANGKTSS